MIRHGQRSRDGMTLLEVIIVVSVVTAMAVVAMRLLDSVLRVQQAASRYAQAAVDLNRLADRLRSDARQASGVQLVDADRQLQLIAGGAGDREGDEEIHYTVTSGNTVQRELRRGGAVVARDAFALLPQARGSAGGPSSRQAAALWQWNADSRVVALQLPAAGDGQRPLAIRIEAVVADAASSDAASSENREAAP